MISLANEVVDIIIDFLHDDKPSLRTCSLTCKTFLPSTRYHLFSDITFTSENIESFVTLLESPSPSSIAPVVRHIILGRLFSYQFNRAMDLIQNATRLTFRLRAVKSLRITSLGLTCAHPSIFKAFLSMIANLSGVEELTLRSIQFERFEHVLDVAYAFPRLRWLSLESVYWALPKSAETITRFKDGPPFRLRTLSSILLDDFAEWMLSRNPVPTVQQLDLPIRHFQKAAFHCALAQMGENVPELRISIDSESLSFMQPATCLTIAIVTRLLPLEEIHITQFTNVQNLHLSITAPPKRSALVRRNRGFIVLVLSQILAHSVKGITFRVIGEDERPGSDYWEDLLDWCEIETILNGPRFIALHEVRIEWRTWSMESRPALEEFFECGPFASLSRRGLVNLELQDMNVLYNEPIFL